jgi:hypothetical protein
MRGISRTAALTPDSRKIIPHTCHMAKFQKFSRLMVAEAVCLSQVVGHRRSYVYGRQDHRCNSSPNAVINWTAQPDGSHSADTPYTSQSDARLPRRGGPGNFPPITAYCLSAPAPPGARSPIHLGRRAVDPVLPVPGGGGVADGNMRLHRRLPPGRFSLAPLYHIKITIG